MAGKIPAVLQTGTQDGYRIATERRKHDRFRMARKKKQAIQKDCLWGVGPAALYQITRAEYKTEPDCIKVKDLIRLFTEFYMPKRIHTIIAEISSGRNKQKRKHRKTSGQD